MPKLSRTGLCGAAAAHGGVAHSALKQSAMHGLEMGQQRGDLRQERIGKHCRDFSITNTARVPDELADIHIEGGGKPLEGAEGGNGLPILDFGDVGAGHLHSAGELTLAEVSRLAGLAYLRRHLQPGFSRRRSGGVGNKLQNGMHGLLDIEGLSALSAEGIGGSVLNEAAIIAAHNLTCLHAYQGGCHRLCAECQSGLSGVSFYTALFATFEEANHNCQVERQAQNGAMPKISHDSRKNPKKHEPN